MMQRFVTFLKAFAFLLWITTCIMIGLSSTANAKVLSNGGDITDAISIVGQEDSHTFTVSAGDYIELRMTDLDGNSAFEPFLQLFGPDSDTRLAYNINEVTASISYTAEQAGNYTLKASDSGGNAQGNYKIYYVKAPGANEHGLLTNDRGHTQVIDIGDLDTYTFTANAGDYIELRMTDLDGNSNFEPYLQLFGPSSGTRLAYNTNEVTACITYIATQTGAYTIIAADAGSTSGGNYNIYYAKAPGANEHGLLANDGVHTQVIDVGDLDTYTFSANVGDYIELRMTDLDGNSNFEPYLQLFGPSNGTRLAYNTNEVTACITYTATQTGTYTIIAADAGSTSGGNYNIYYAKAPGANEHGLLANDGVHTQVIDVGDLDTYTFSANVGDYIELRMTDLDGNSNFEPYLQLFGPSNGTRLAYNTNEVTACITYTATQTGTYTIIAADAGSTSGGNYNIYYAKAPGANEHGLLANDGVHTQVIDVGDLDTYTFSANVGDYIELRMTDLDGNSNFEPYLQLFGPSNGTRLAYNTNEVTASISYTATQTGTYTIIAADAGSTSGGNYNIYYIKIPDAGKHAIENSNLSSESIEQGEMDTYTFTVNAGDVIELQVSDVSSTSAFRPCIELYGPEGSFISSDCDYNTAYLKYTAIADGVYTLLVSDSRGTGEGTYMLSYYNDAYPIKYCNYDFDGDKDIDGVDLLNFMSDYDTYYIYDIKGLEHFAASFGKVNYETSE
nr:pre-peptidase C-terminal domain-containing protein [uncultured Desulfobacter sp.]